MCGGLKSPEPLEINPFLFPTGLFDIILIEVPKSSATPDQKAERPQAANVPKISDFIGYGRKFHPEYRSTEDVMRELREGEED